MSEKVVEEACEWCGGPVDVSGAFWTLEDVSKLICDQCAERELADAEEVE